MREEDRWAAFMRVNRILDDMVEAQSRSRSPSWDEDRAAQRAQQAFRQAREEVAARAPWLGAALGLTPRDLEGEAIAHAVAQARRSPATE